jgi:chemotaxis protein MotB
MAEHHPEIVIIKKKVVHGGAHHGGAWKIAFADFMTAMMAFFLVLWIINATDKDTKSVIARYFNPTKLENPARARKGVHGVDQSRIVSNDAKGDQTPDTLPPENPAINQEKAVNDKPIEQGGVGPAAPPSVGTPPKKDEKPKTVAAVAHPEARSAVDVRPTMSETALFSDPYKALDKIVGGRSTDDAMPPGPDTGDDEPSRLAGSGSLEAFRDPFKPIGPGAPDAPVTMDADAPPTPTPDMHPDIEPQRAGSPPQAAAAPPKPDDIPPAKAAPPAVPSAPPSPDAGPAPPKVATTLQTADLQRELQQKLATTETGSGPGVAVEATKDGLLVSLTDKLNYSMFAVGSAEPRVELIKAMEAIAGLLKSRPGALIVRGHTDARPFRSGVYDNWRLSSDRAQMAYYMLTRAGLPESRFERIEGHADHALRDPAHPNAAENRRIEILIRETKP